MTNKPMCLLSDCKHREGCSGVTECLRMAEFWKLMPPLSSGETYSDFMSDLVPCFISDEDFVFSIGMVDDTLLNVLIPNYNPLISSCLKQVFGKKFNVAFSRLALKGGIDMKSKELELVRRFFEDDHYRSVAAEVCEPNMGPAVEAYLLDQYYRQRDFDGLDLTRLVSCLQINDSEALKELLFRGLDLWAENHFNPDMQISATMESYIFEVFQCLEDRVSPEKYVGPTGLRHIDLLKQYLNRALGNERMVALWNDYFPIVFEDYLRRPPFAIIFLLMMLDENLRKPASAIQLDLEPLAMLVRCGYAYFYAGNTDELNRATFNILCAVQKISIENKFYLREEHEEEFSCFMDDVLLHGLQKETLKIIESGDKALRELILMRSIKPMIFKRNGMRRDDLETLVKLIDKIPTSCMADFREDWNWVLTEVGKIKNQ